MGKQLTGWILDGKDSGILQDDLTKPNRKCSKAISDALGPADIVQVLVALPQPKGKEHSAVGGSFVEFSTSTSLSNDYLPRPLQAPTL